MIVRLSYSRQTLLTAAKYPTKVFSQITGRQSYRIQPTRATQGDGRLDTQDSRTFSDFDSRGRQTRLATRVTTIPRRVDLYFAGNLLRRALWAFIAFCVGYYSANTVSLSFGALAINDIVAAIVTVAFCETYGTIGLTSFMMMSLISPEDIVKALGYYKICSKAYYSAPRTTLKLVFVNSFKMGVTAALIGDAFKLGG